MSSVNGSSSGSKMGPSESRSRLRKAGDDHWYRDSIVARGGARTGERGAGVGATSRRSKSASSTPSLVIRVKRLWVYASSQSMLFPGVLTEAPLTSSAPRKLSTTVSPMPTPVHASALALEPEKRTLTWPFFRRRRKSGSPSRNANWRAEEEYGHISITTPRICFDSSECSSGLSWEIGISSIGRCDYPQLISMSMLCMKASSVPSVSEACGGEVRLGGSFRGSRVASLRRSSLSSRLT